MAKLVSKVYGEALFEAAVDHGNAIQLMNETAQELFPSMKKNFLREALLTS